MVLVLVLTVSMMLTACGGEADAPAEPPEQDLPDEPAGNGNGDAAPGEDMDEAALEELFRAVGTLDEFSYEMRVTSAEGEGFVSRIWMKGDRMRTETEMDGASFITIYDQNAVYTMDVQERIAYIMPLEMGMDDSLDSFTADDFIGEVDAGQWEDLGADTVNGLPARMVRIREPEYDSVTTLWLHAEYGFPLRVETTGDDLDDGFTMEVTRFQVGQVSDDMFKVPDGYQIIDMMDMFDGLPEMP